MSSFNNLKGPSGSNFQSDKGKFHTNPSKPQEGKLSESLSRLQQSNTLQRTSKEEDNKNSSVILIASHEGVRIFKPDTPINVFNPDNPESLSVVKAFHIQGPASHKNLATWEVAQALGEPFTQVIAKPELENYQGNTGTIQETPWPKATVPALPLIRDHLVDIHQFQQELLAIQEWSPEGYPLGPLLNVFELEQALGGHVQKTGDEYWVMQGALPIPEKSLERLTITPFLQSCLNTVERWSAEGEPLGPDDAVLKLITLAEGPIRKINGEYYVDHPKMITEDPLLKEQLVALQIVDYICGQVDRHASSYQVHRDPLTQRFLGVKAWDNECAFGEQEYTLEDAQQWIASSYQGVSLPPVISETMYQAIMNLDGVQLQRRLISWISDNAYSYVQKRIQTLQEQATLLKSEGHVISNSDWGKPAVTHLLTQSSMNLLPSSSYYGRDLKNIQSIANRSMIPRKDKNHKTE